MKLIEKAKIKQTNHWETESDENSRKIFSLWWELCKFKEVVFFVHRWRCSQWSISITPFRSRSRSRSGSLINRSLTISKKWSNDQIDLDQQSITTSLFHIW